MHAHSEILDLELKQSNIRFRVPARMLRLAVFHGITVLPGWE
jgi:hypothetical protein